MSSRRLTPEEAPLAHKRDRIFTVWVDSTEEGPVCGFKSKYHAYGQSQECIAENMEEIVGLICSYVVTSFTGTSEEFQSEYSLHYSKSPKNDC